MSPACAEEQREATSPRQFIELLNKAESQIAARKFDEARELLAQLLQADGIEHWPDVFLVFYFQGKAHFGLEAYQKAVEDFSKTLELWPTHSGRDDEKSQVHFDRGLALDNLGRLEEAIEDYTLRLILLPKSPRALNNRAVAYFKLERFQKAVDDMTAYLKLDPEWPNAYFIRGVSRAQLGDRVGLADIKIAAGMGHELAQKTLREIGVEW